MYDQRITMPLGRLPYWSQDERIDDPGETWHEKPTKNDPGTGKRRDGYLPGEHPPAQELNQLLHELGQWVQYLSAIPVMNWQYAGALPDSSDTAHCVTYDEVSKRWLMGGDNDGIAFSIDGVTFGRELTGTLGQPIWSVCAQSPLRSLFVANLGNDLRITERDNGAYTNMAVNGGILDEKRATCAVWDPQNQKWIIAGRRTTPVDSEVRFWTSNSPATAFTEITPPTTGTSISIVDMAHGEDVDGNPITVAIGNGVGFTIWTTSNATSFTAHAVAGVQAGQFPRSIMWCPARKIFALTTSSQCYTSVDGVTWVIKTGFAALMKVASLVSDGGGLWITVSEDTAMTSIYYSRDGGSVWRQVMVPPNDTAVGDGRIRALAYSRVAGRFGASWTRLGVANAAHWLTSIAVGETVLKSGNAILPPILI